MMLRRFKQGYANPEQTCDSAQQAFLKGDIAFLLNGTWVVDQYNEEAKVTYRTVDFPTLFNQPATWANSRTWVIPPHKEADPVRYRAAVEFIGYLYDHVDAWALDTGHLPGGTQTDAPIACSVGLGRAICEAQAHSGAGTAGAAACSGDPLLGALAARAQLTCQTVATALAVPVEGIEVTVEGDLDLRGTLGVAKDVPAGRPGAARSWPGRPRPGPPARPAPHADRPPPAWPPPTVSSRVLERLARGTPARGG